jgi:hypothetical protein
MALAAAPAALLGLGWGAEQTGLSDWRGGFGLLILEWAPRLALASVASGAHALVLALQAGFRRYWRPALLILAITTATLAGYLWTLRPDHPADPANGFAAAKL